MSISETQLSEATARTVSADDQTLKVSLSDGRVVVVPLTWFPRLADGTPVERSNWQLIGRGEGIHWPNLDEDISVESMLAGRKSGETRESLLKWQSNRSARITLERQLCRTGAESVVFHTLEMQALNPHLTGQSESPEQPMLSVPSPSGACAPEALVQSPLGWPAIVEQYPSRRFVVSEPQEPQRKTSSRLRRRSARKRRSFGAPKELAA